MVTLKLHEFLTFCMFESKRLFLLCPGNSADFCEL